MEEDLGLGPMNGHAVGRILKEAVRRAMVVAISQRDAFETFSKPGYGTKMEDVFTSADSMAQEIYLRTFTECFPNAGVIGEEASLHIEPKNGCRVYFTVDPIDGTKAYIRRQSHGIATMVAMVQDDEVIAAYIGDVCADEVYGFRPGSKRVHRITRLDRFEELLPPPVQETKNLYLMLRDPPGVYTKASRRVMGLFKNHEVIGSSIGTWMARLWKQEVGGLLMPEGTETPWDSSPIIGISLKLGYVFLRPCADGHTWEHYNPVVPRAVCKRSHDSLVVHSSIAARFCVPQLAQTA